MHLELSRTSTMKLFCENSFIVDFWQGSKYTCACNLSDIWAVHHYLEPYLGPSHLSMMKLLVKKVTWKNSILDISRFLLAPLVLRCYFAIFEIFALLLHHEILHFRRFLEKLTPHVIYYPMFTFTNYTFLEGRSLLRQNW